MERELGTTGIRLFPIGLGAMPLSISGRPAESAAHEVIAAALDAGVNLIDTANSYCLDDSDTGHNERLIGASLRRLGAQQRVLVATKGGLVRPGGAWRVDARPERLRRACEQSLKDLGVERIALYQLHAPDDRVPFEDSVGALAALQQEGKIAHIGLSNVSARQLDAAQALCRVESVQNQLNPQHTPDLAGRLGAQGLLQRCAEQGVSYLPYSPVGGGYGHQSLARHTVLTELTHKYGTSPYCIVLAWLLGLGPHVLPIPGASKVASITDSARAVTVQLAPEDAKRVEMLR